VFVPEASSSRFGLVVICFDSAPLSLFASIDRVLCIDTVLETFLLIGADLVGVRPLDRGVLDRSRRETCM